MMQSIQPAASSLPTWLWYLVLLALSLAFWLPGLDGAWPTLYKEAMAAASLVFWLLAIRPVRVHAVSVFLLALCGCIALQYTFGLVVFRDDTILSIAYLLMAA